MFHSGTALGLGDVTSFSENHGLFRVYCETGFVNDTVVHDYIVRPARLHVVPQSLVILF